MTNSFVTNAHYQSGNNWKQTENGADALYSTGSSVLNFYSQSGAIRNREDSFVIRIFEQALKENPVLAIRSLFHARSIARNGVTGNGERKIFRTILNWLGNKYPRIVEKIIHFVPEYGRWDDLFVLIGTMSESEMVDFVGNQLAQDIVSFNDNENVSLLAKWMPSINTSSQETVNKAKFFSRKFDFTPGEYRKTLSALRNYIDIVESKMSSNNWEAIDFEKVPSQAMSKLRKAFGKHQNSRFLQYLEAVKSGEKKINAGTLNPSDIFTKLGFVGPNDMRNWEDSLQVMWDNLPDYVDNTNILVMADTSGSMNGLPMTISVSLAVYFAERNKGAFKNLFMTFSETPEFVSLRGKTLDEKVRGIKGIVANTNLEAAFEKILQLAITKRISQEDMPKALVVISDQEFDSATSGGFSRSRNGLRSNFTELMEEKFINAGYEMPVIVYWNADSRHDEGTFHAHQTQKGVQLVSGQNASTFKNVINVLNGKPHATPYEAMLEVLAQFDKIQI
jgi:hypothetical protein